MIPGIEEILHGLLAGKYTEEQCVAWINAHIELAADRDGLRDHFAAQAMQARLTAGWSSPQPTNAAYRTWRADQPAGADESYNVYIAAEAYAAAEAMLAARAASIGAAMKGTP